MPERGGPTTQSGIVYQNSISALYLGRLCDMSPRPARERVVEVRIEAPEYVDDTVVRYADRHREWIQAKEALDYGGEPWKKLWKDFSAQRWNPSFGSEDRLVLVLGTSSDRHQKLRELCFRATGSEDYRDWNSRLTDDMTSLLESIRLLLPSEHRDDEPVFGLFSKVDVQIATLRQIERDDVPRWMPPSNTEPQTLFRLLRDRCGGHARNREVFRASRLLSDLADEHDVSIEEQGAGAPAYRDALINVSSRIEVPGTNLSGSIERLFFWPTLQEARLEDVRAVDPESEDPRYQLSSKRGSIDLRDFPISPLERAVIVAGAGFGKTVLLSAVGHRLAHTPRLPALIPLPELADSGETVVEFLKNHINRRFDVSVSWDYYCDDGRAVLLFDGLDELPPRERRRVLGLVEDFYSRYDAVPWLLTVRDAKALSAPVDAKVLKIDVFDDTQIRAFAEAYRGAGSTIDVSELTSQLRAYPDLRLLARIPLFLALLLATVQASESLPRNRSDLLEHYLHVVLHPEEYKPSVSIDLGPMELREVAEQLAFVALEEGKTRLSEAEIGHILRGSGTEASPTDYVSDLVVCGLLQRSSYWLNFAFPIVQEYLAAHYLVTNYPDEVIGRFELVARRPWAQALQFAVEQHPEADQLIGELIEQPDDAFGTVLRLLGQCIVNGAHVSATTRSRVGEKLGALWLSLPYPLRENVGKLLANGFTTPLPGNVRVLLEQGRGLSSGGSEIVVACNNLDLTERVLAAKLEQDLKSSYHLHELQVAVDDIAPRALQMYIERVKADRTTDAEKDSLASLIQDMSSEHLSLDAYKLVTEDRHLPPLIRLAGYLLGPQPLPQEALILAEEILRAPKANHLVPGWTEATYALWRSADPVERWVSLVRDVSLPEERRDEVLFAIFNSNLEAKEQVRALERVRSTECLTTDLEHTALLIQGYLGDLGILSDVADSLQELSFDNLCLWAYLIGKDPSEANVSAALKKLTQLTLTSEQKAQLGSAFRFGLGFDIEMGAVRGAFAGKAQRLHSAATECGRILWEWADSYDGDVGVSLSLLSSAVELGYGHATDPLREIVTAVIQHQPDSFRVFEFDSRVNGALRALADSEPGRSALPLSTLRRCVEVATSNAARQAVRMIASFASMEALDTLIELHSLDKSSFIRDGIETSVDELAGRLGARIIRDGDRLLRT